MAVPIETVRHTEPGMVIPIGGGGGRKIFASVAGEIPQGTDLAIVTVNSTQELNAFDYNQRMFRKVGFQGDIRHVHSYMRPEQAQEVLMENIGGIYVGGGDQRRGLKIMEQLGIDTVIADLNREHGVVIAGTSAGASEIAEIAPMEDSKIPGLNLVNGVIIDQHFAQRVRYDRLFDLVQKEKLLGIGVDEDTGFMIDPEGKARVIGRGDVYIMPPSNGRAYEPIQMRPNEEIDLREWVNHTVYHREDSRALAAD